MGRTQRPARAPAPGSPLTRELRGARRRIGASTRPAAAGRRDRAPGGRRRSSAGRVFTRREALPVYLRDDVAQLPAGTAVIKLTPDRAFAVMNLQHRASVIPAPAQSSSHARETGSDRRGRAPDPRNDRLRPEARRLRGPRGRGLPCGARRAGRHSGPTWCWSTGCCRT